MKSVKDERISLERIAHLCEDLLKRKQELQSPDDFLNETDCAKIISFDLIQISETFIRLDSKTIMRFHSVSQAAIKGLRNILVHDYGRINGSLVCSTLNEDIEPLLIETREILASGGF
jgi:uncharacterized protein with HEPN domain